MKWLKTRRNSAIMVFLIALIALLVIAGSFFQLNHGVTIALITLLILLLAAIALWNKATRRADGSEWWQDDKADGWRGDF